MNLPNFIRSYRGVIIALAVFALAMPILAAAMSGAIYTTNQSGGRVNQNIYFNQRDVYLNGGPNNANSAGLPANEVFYFEVTDPSGKTLLSSDDAACRQLMTNADGRVSGAFVGDGCFHQNGALDVTNGSTGVQLFPYDQTPNNGGEYKVTLIRKNDPSVSIDEDGRHINYSRSAAKSDNFKVRVQADVD